MSSNNHSHWQNFRGKIRTKIGKWIGGEDVICRGKSLMHEMLGNASYMQVVVLNATGKMIDERLAKWLEGNFIGMSYPDARIWCNQVGALAGINKVSVAAATVAGTLASDSRGYGGSQTALHGMNFIQNALKQFKDGLTVAEIVQNARHKNGKPVIVGYARPVARTDERIAPHRKMTEKLGFEIGEHMALANTIADYIESKYGLGINIGGYTSAFLSDQGFTPMEVYRIKSLCVASGVTACYVDHHDSQITFLPLECGDIEYKGAAPRAIPKVD